MSLPFKTILALDFETRWSSADYTLSKMTTEAYIRDPRFKAFGVCIHEYGTDKHTQWYKHEELPRIFSCYDWTKTAVLAHNAMFDIGIMSMIYGINPCFIFDSLSMARALRGVEVGNSLSKLAEAFELPPKGRAVHSTDGLEELTPEIEAELLDYCKHDVFLCEEIFTRLLTGLHGGGRIAPRIPLQGAAADRHDDPHVHRAQTGAGRADAGEGARRGEREAAGGAGAMRCERGGVGQQ